VVFISHRLTAAERQVRLRHRKGAVLLVVLFVIMVITVTSLGFLSKSNVELACGRNMQLRGEMDYTVESGLEHARGLIIRPQEVSSEYWTGGTGLQIGDGDDYYDVGIVRDDSDPSDRCNYIIDCNSYRLRGGGRIGRSEITALLRLDPCIALGVGTSGRLTRRVTVNGDVYFAGDLGSGATINGDAFSRGAINGARIEGRSNEWIDEAPIVWPWVSASNYSSTYYVGTTAHSVEIIGSSVHSSGAFNPSAGNPGGVRYHLGDLELPGGVSINGLLAVRGDVTIKGSNSITGVKSFPALLVDGNLIIDAGGQLAIEGLAVMRGRVQISSDEGDLDVVGALFARAGISETVVDSSGNGNEGAIGSDLLWQPSGGRTGGALEFDGLNDEVVDTGARNYLNGLSAVTFSTWVKSDVIDQDRGIMFSCEPTDADADLGIRYDGIGAFGGGVRVIKASVRATTGYTQIESTSNMQTTSWQHLALVWESGKSLKLYVNGVLNPLTYDSGAVSGTVTGVTKLVLGLGTKGRFWDGMLDDVRIYDHALDPNEIYPPVEGVGGLLLHWKFDEVGCDIDVSAAPCKTAIMRWSAAHFSEVLEEDNGITIAS